MDPVTLLGGALLVAGVNIENLIILGVGSVVGLLLIFGLVQAGLAVFYARSLNNQVSQGIQAIVGVNNMTTLDRAMEDQKRRPQQAPQSKVVNNGGDDDSSQ